MPGLGKRQGLTPWLPYLDFCHEYTVEPTDGKSLPHFDGKLQEKGQADWMRRQAQQAVSLYYELIAERNDDASTRVAAPPPPAGVGRDASQPEDKAALQRKTAGRSHSTGAALPAAMNRSVPSASRAGPMAEASPLSSHAVPGPTAPAVPAPRVAEGVEDGHNIQGLTPIHIVTLDSTIASITGQAEFKLKDTGCPGSGNPPARISSQGVGGRPSPMPPKQGDRSSSYAEPRVDLVEKRQKARPDPHALLH